MTEQEASDWIVARFGDAAKRRCETFIDLLVAEMERQNLIAASTLPVIWTRHIVDSAQLVDLAPPSGIWLDVGTGAGFPGLIVAICRGGPMRLVEPRRRRAEFLSAAIVALSLHDVQVRAEAAQATDITADIISARAVASANEVLSLTEHIAHKQTIWLLPKGRSSQAEVADVRHQWHGVFHVEPSLTSQDGGIIVAKQVRRRT